MEEGGSRRPHTLKVGLPSTLLQVHETRARSIATIYFSTSIDQECLNTYRPCDYFQWKRRHRLRIMKSLRMVLIIQWLASIISFAAALERKQTTLQLLLTGPAYILTMHKYHVQVIS